MNNEHYIQVIKKARYFTFGNQTATVKNIWFICHGYGQLANDFLSDFKNLDCNTNFILAPEALSRFYLGGASSKVGASWMTKEDRLEEIADYINYLDLLYGKIIKKYDRTKVKINLLGFSQGAATIGRWVLSCRPDIDSIIFWAGDLPGEELLINNIDFLNSKKIIVVFGENDPFVKRSNIFSQFEILQKHNVNYQVVRFEGKHEISPSVLFDISRLLS